jgi:hypothetical protein
VGFKVECSACGGRLVIPDDLWERRFAGRTQSLKCKKCGERIDVDDRGRSRSAMTGSPIQPTPTAAEPVESTTAMVAATEASPVVEVAPVAEATRVLDAVPAVAVPPVVETAREVSSGAKGEGVDLRATAASPVKRTPIVTAGALPPTLGARLSRPSPLVQNTAREAPRLSDPGVRLSDPGSRLTDSGERLSDPGRNDKPALLDVRARHAEPKVARELRVGAPLAAKVVSASGPPFQNAAGVVAPNRRGAPVEGASPRGVPSPRGGPLAPGTTEGAVAKALISDEEPTVVDSRFSKDGWTEEASAVVEARTTKVVEQQGAAAPTSQETEQKSTAPDSGERAALALSSWAAPAGLGTRQPVPPLAPPPLATRALPDSTSLAVPSIPVPNAVTARAPSVAPPNPPQRNGGTPNSLPTALGTLPPSPPVPSFVGGHAAASSVAAEIRPAAPAPSRKRWVIGALVVAALLAATSVSFLLLRGKFWGRPIVSEPAGRHVAEVLPEAALEEKVHPPGDEGVATAEPGPSAAAPRAEEDTDAEGLAVESPAAAATAEGAVAATGSPEATAPEDAIYEATVVNPTLDQLVKRVTLCHLGGRAGGTALLTLAFTNDGRVSDARLEGEPIASAPVSRCILAHAKALSLPGFKGEAFEVTRSITLD